MMLYDADLNVGAYDDHAELLMAKVVMTMIKITMHHGVMIMIKG